MADATQSVESNPSVAQPAERPLSWRLIRDCGRARELVAFEETVVEFFLESAEVLGVPKSLGAIYGVCFASPAPLSYSEVRDRLNISAGSISQGLRILREVNALRVVKTTGSKRELFEPDLELRRLVSHYLEQRVEKQLGAGRNRLKAIGEALPQGTPEATQILKDRLKSLQGWHDKSLRLLPVIRVLLKLSA